MTGDSGGSDSLTEAEIREIVTDELSNHESKTSRRNLIGSIGLVGLAGLAGCSSDEPSEVENPNPNPTPTPSQNPDPNPNPTEAQPMGYLAERGDVQSSLVDAFEDDVGLVALSGGAAYELEASTEIPPGVCLDCSGATIDLVADVNGFELHTQSRIVNPRVRTTQVEGYSSSIFHVKPAQFGEQFGTNRPAPNWTVTGGWSEMTPDEGTCIELHGVRANQDGEYDASRDTRNVYFCFISHNCFGGRRYAYLHRDGGETTRGGHVNGNIIRGLASHASIFVETDDTAAGKNMVNGNKFHLATQPRTDDDFKSEWLWYANKGGRNELFEWGKNWDYGSYSDTNGDGYGENWYIGSNAGKNYIWRKNESASGGLGSTVLDESDGDSNSKYLVLDHMGTPVEDLDTWE